MKKGKSEDFLLKMTYFVYINAKGNKYTGKRGTRKRDEEGEERKN
jgi:hypothetical protein